MEAKKLQSAMMNKSLAGFVQSTQMVINRKHEANLVINRLFRKVHNLLQLLHSRMHMPTHPASVLPVW